MADPQTQSGISEYKRLQGIGVLACLAAVCVLGNLFACASIGWASRPVLKSLPTFIIVGVVFSQPFLLAIWTAFSPETKRLRSLKLLCAAAALISSWVLGVFFLLNLNESISRQISVDGYWVVFLVPCCFVAALIPLILSRQIVGIYFAFPNTAASPKYQQFSILGLMISTTVIAAAIGVAHFPIYLGVAQTENFLFVVGILSAIIFCISLVWVLPLVFLSMKEGGRYWLWTNCFAGVVPILIFATIAISSWARTGRFRIDWIEFCLIAAGFLTAALCVIAFVGGLRRLGYRCWRRNR